MSPDLPWARSIASGDSLHLACSEAHDQRVEAVQHAESASVEQTIVGRDQELAAIAHFLESCVTSPQVLFISGEPGIGKTLLWESALDQAQALGFTVLSCRTVESETKLAFASLADLIGPVFDVVAPALAEPQRASLEIALLRASPKATPPDLRAIGTGLLSIARELSSRSPTLLAVDDVQWLDEASASALGFALRRIGPEPVGFLATSRRTDDRSDQGLVGLWPHDNSAATHIRVGPLSLSGVHHLLRSRLGTVLPRPTLERVLQASGGNPLFALDSASTV